MGLFMTPGNVHWASASELHRFRIKVAKHIGIDLGAMEGYKSWTTRDMRQPNYRGTPWTDVSTPLKPLLLPVTENTEYTVEQMKAMLPDLMEIVESWQTEDELFPKGVRLIYALGESIAMNVSMRFE